MSRLSRRITLFILVLAVCCSVFIIWNAQKTAPEKEVFIQLGQKLFFDSRLSWNGSRSCSGCHHPDFGWSDGYRTSITPDGTPLLRNSPGLLNCADQQFFNRADPLTSTLESQHLRPLFHENPLELGLHLDSVAIFQKLSSDTGYVQLLQKLGVKHINGPLVVKSLSAFVKSIQGGQSKFDRHLQKKLALNDKESKGWVVFNQLNCISCHPPPHFTRNTKGATQSTAFVRLNSHQNDSGAYLRTGKMTDTFLFCIPSLRNVAITAPYLHDGSAMDLTQALELHDLWMPGTARDIKQVDKIHLIHFLHTLTDTNYVAIP